jgi:hypothetical protein
VAPEPSLHQQLRDARINVQHQIDRLRARAYPIAPIGLVPGGEIPMVLTMFGMLPWRVAPFGANGVIIDNSELIERLTKLLHDIDDALEGLGPESP